MAGKEEKPDTSIGVREAGRLGGKVTRDRYGHEFYEQIGKKGGETVRRMIERGKQAEKGVSSDGGS